LLAAMAGPRLVALRVVGMPLLALALILGARDLAVALEQAAIFAVPAGVAFLQTTPGGAEATVAAAAADPTTVRLGNHPTSDDADAPPAARPRTAPHPS
jgi:hypothetical protein